MMHVGFFIIGNFPVVIISDSFLVLSAHATMVTKILFQAI